MLMTQGRLKVNLVNSICSRSSSPQHQGQIWPRTTDNSGGVNPFALYLTTSAREHDLVQSVEDLMWSVILQHLERLQRL